MDARAAGARYRRYLPGAAAVGAIALVTALIVALDPDNPTRAELFVGRLHPLVVHLPIGFLILAVLLETLSRVRGYRRLRHAIPVVLILSAVSAVAAAVAGYQLALGGGYDGPTVAWHRRLGIGVAVGAVLVSVLWYASATSRATWLRRAYVGALAATVALLLVASHLGGSLTHGPEYLTEYLPAPLRLGARADTAATAFVRLDEAGAYEHLVRPVLQSRCVSCHGAEKKKGDLRLDTPEAIRKGGESGPSVVPGKPEESELIRRIWLPEGHEDHMPPKGRATISVAEAELLRWWIAEGAPFDRPIADLAPTPAVEPVLEEIAGPPDRRISSVFREKVAPPDSAALAAARAAGLAVRPVAGGASLVQVRCRANSACGAAQLRAVLPLAEQVTLLDLAGADIADSDLALVGRLPRLTRLHLERTSVSDAGLAELAPLRHLEYLNLFGTKVSDAGLRHLAGLRSLRSLYLWQTAATPAGAARLRERLPRLAVKLGLSSGEMDSVLTAARMDSIRTAEAEPRE